MTKYNLKTHCVDEQPTMDEPMDISVHTDEAVSQYRRHIISLRSIPVSGKVDWKDGEDVTGKFEIKKTTMFENEKYAIPIKVAP